MRSSLDICDLFTLVCVKLHKMILNIPVLFLGCILLEQKQLLCGVVS